MSAPPRIYVLLPVHNRRATTEGFIRCLLAQTYKNWHLVLIDDGSKDGTADMARALVPDVTVLRGKGNWWWGGALQQGRNWLQRQPLAADDIVLINNDDTAFDPDFLANAARVLRPRSMLLAQQHDMEGNFLEVGVHWDWKKLKATAVRDEANLNCFPTRGLFLRAADFLEIGRFHPVLLPHYLSDYEFTLRAGRKGYAFQTSSDVYLRLDDTQTGLHGIEGSALQATLRLFSVRSSSNPFYWTSFIVLACPSRYIPLNILRTWWGMLLPIRISLRPYLFYVRVTLRYVKRQLKKMSILSAL